LLNLNPDGSPFSSSSIFSVTVLGSFVVLYFFDGTLQRVSLGAFIVAMGMLVDNAIVVVDGILVDSARGMKKPQSLVHTANITARPLLGATLIAIIAFMPVSLSPDMAGEYARDLFIVLAVSLLLSWILALVHVPIHSEHYLKIKTADDNPISVFPSPALRALCWLKLMSMLMTGSSQLSVISIAEGSSRIIS
jgi:multidrug efflux pump subunit AcrB